MKSAIYHSSLGSPILIIDKLGLIGESLSVGLSKDYFVVLVGGKASGLRAENKNLFRVSFSGKFPTIPDEKFSHIIFIDEDAQGLEILPKIIEKVKKNNSKLIFAQEVFLAKNYTIDKILRLCPESKIILYGDIFDNKLILKRGYLKSTVNKFIYQAQKFGKMQVGGEGLGMAYPVFLQDVVDELINLITKKNKSNSSLLYLFPKCPPTELTLAHMIQKANPEILIDFLKNGSGSSKTQYPLNGEYVLPDKYPLAQKIREIDIKRQIKEDGDFKESARKFKKLPAFIFLILVLLLFSPFIFTLIFYFLGLNIFRYAGAEIKKGNMDSAGSSIHLSQTFFSLAKSTSNLFSLQTKFMGEEKALKNFIDEINTKSKISESFSQALTAEAYFYKTMSGKSNNTKEDFIKGENYLKNSILTLDKIKADEKIPASINQNVKKIDSLIKLLSSTLDILPSIVGMEGPRTYLILFQDNLQLRPGGGIIASYGILKFNMGKVVGFSINDTSSADGMLRGHLEPPFAIRRYLPSAHWYMKDSSFDVDFNASALSAENFILVETNQKTDGVVGIDSSFIKNILHVTGPVSVDDLKQTINEGNVYVLIKSSKNRNFLGLIFKAIITKITSEKISTPSILQAVSDAIDRKDLLFSFNNFKNIFTANGWSSSLYDDRKNVQDVINDFVGINEANLSINEINDSVSREVSQKVEIGDDGNISEELIINYKNETVSLSTNDYLNYLRIILPNGAALSEITIDGNIQKVVNAVTDSLVYEAKNFKAPQGLEVEKKEEDGKTIFGFPVKIPAGKTVQIKIKYALLQKVSVQDAFSYNLKLFKQPGVDNVPYSFSVVFPDSFSIIENSDGISGVGNSVSYINKIIKDKDLNINFAKNK